MPFSRSRYVTVCQQSLVTGAVLVVGISAAGVKTLDIVPQPGASTSQVVGGASAPSAQEGSGPRATGSVGSTGSLPPGNALEKTPADIAPVTPKVREVRVQGIEADAPTPTAPRTSRPTPGARPSTPAAPESSAPTTPRAVPRTVAGKQLVALSAPTAVKGYATVGVTWAHGRTYSPDQLLVQVRTEDDGTWSSWRTTDVDEDDGPDADSAENVRPGTAALVIGDVDRVQMRAASRDGRAVPDLTLAVIDPGTGKQTLQRAATETAATSTPSAGTAEGTQAVTTEEGQDSIALSAMKTAAKPTIYSRAQWGANEKLRDQSAPAYGTVKAGFIHHTVNANNYSASQVPALLRGIYAYHTQSRGWRDIGYNYLVDRFGKIWEGRYGGITKAVVGAHTLGYNEVSFAMSAIGNYDVTAPPQAVLTAYAKLFAWKLSLYGIRADATRISLKGKTLHAINGHRDVGQTACPGRYLYAKIPYVRTLAQKYQDAAQSGTTVPTPTPTPTPTPEPSSTFSTPTQRPLAWTAQPAGITFPASTNLTGSAYPDLLLKRSDGLVRVLPTGGQVGFKAPVSTPASWSSMSLVAAVGDLTGDGRGDVLARLAKDGSTRVYTGDGTGRVATRGIAATTAFRDAVSVTAAGDWNRDARPDVLMTDKASRLWMVPGAGKGAFGAPVLLSRSWSAYSSTAVPGDLTGDARPDVVAINRDGYLYVVPSTSKGALGTPVKRRAVGSAFDTLAGGAGNLGGSSVGDLVIRSSSTGRSAIMTGKSGGDVGAVLGWFTSTAGLKQFSAAQMTGTSQPDLVGVNAAGTALVVLPHNGLTNAGTAITTTLKVPGATQLLSAGDWDGDGRGDLITREGSGDTLVLRRGLGDGRFAAGVTMAKGWRTVTTLAAVGDVTGDKHPDLAGRTSRGMTVFPGNGKAGFLAPRSTPPSLMTFNLMGAGAWKPATSPSSYLASDGSFVPTAGGIGGNPAAYDWIVGPGDVDGDGRSDLVVRDAAGTLWLIPGTSTGLGSRRLLASGFGGYQLVG